MKLKIQPIREIKHHTIIFSVDGINHELFMKLLKNKKLPNIQKYIYDRALIRIDEALSSYPSMTTFAHDAYMTGKKSRFALRIYHKQLKKVFDYSRLWALAEKKACEKHITLNHLIRPSATILEHANKGANVKYRYGKLIFPLISNFITQLIANTFYNKIFVTKKAPIGLINNLLLAVDQTVTKKAVEILSKKRIPKLLTIWFAGIDEIMHENGPNYISEYGYVFIDECIGKIAKTVEKKGLLDKFVFVLLSDHGNAPVKFNHNIDGILRKHKLKYDLAKPIKQQYKVVATTFGEGTAYVYITDEHLPNTRNKKLRYIINKFLNEQSTGFVIARGDCCIELISKKGVCYTVKKLINGEYKYSMHGNNILEFKFKNKPFNLVFNKNKWYNEEELHAIIHDQENPVMISDIIHIFEDEKSSPDLIINSAKEHDYSSFYNMLIYKNCKTADGKICRESMILPLVFAGPKHLIEKPIVLDSARLHHIAPTLLELLGIDRKTIYSYGFDTKTIQHLHEENINQEFRKFKSR